MLARLPTFYKTFLIPNSRIYWAEQLPEDESIMLVNYKNKKSIKSLTAYVSAAPTIGWWSPQINLGMVKQWFTLNTSTGSYQLNHPIFVADFNNTFSLSPRLYC